MRKIEELKKFFEIRLNLLIKERDNLKNTELAKETGIDRNDIGDYRKGYKIPTIEKLIKLADFFGVSTSYLLGETDARTADDTIIGNELGIDDTTLNNLKEIKKFNQKYNNEYQDILGEVLTDVELYKTIVEKIDLYVRYYSDKEYQKEYDSNNNIFLMKVHDQVDFYISAKIKSQVESYLYSLQNTKDLNERSLGEYESKTRIKRLKTEIRHIKEADKRRNKK